MYVVALAVQLYQLGLEVGADLGEDRSECFDSMAIKDAVAAFGDKDQMDVHCRSAMPAVSKVLDFVHGPDNLPSPTFWGSFFGKSLDRALSFCFISTDERRSSSQGAKATSPRTARSDRDPARFAIGSPDLPSPRLPEVPPGRRPPGLGPHGGLSRRTDAPVHGSRRTQGAGPAVAAKLSKVAGQVGSDLRAQSRIVKGGSLGYFFELVLFHH